MDIVAAAYGDNLVNPAVKPKLSAYATTQKGVFQFLEKTRGWTEEQFLLYSESVPTFRRKGTISYRDVTLPFEFELMGEGPQEKLTSLDQIDEVVRSRNYCFSCVLSSPSNVPGLKKNYPIFEFAVVKSSDGKKEENRLDDIRYVSGTTLLDCDPKDVPKLFSKNYFDMVVLVASLTLINGDYKHKEGSLVDPIEITSDFLQLIKNCSLRDGGK